MTTKKPKDLYPIPDWMRELFPLFQNTGGNDVEDLLHDEDTSMFANSIRYTLITSARSQYALLTWLRAAGTLKVGEGA